MSKLREPCYGAGKPLGVRLVRGLWGISSPCTHRNKPTTRHLRTWNRVSFPLWKESRNTSTAEEHLQETEAAEQLLGNDLYDFCQNESIQPKLLAQLKQDDRLARQLFQSAYADSPQEELIAACDRLGEQTLKAHLQTLLDQNPFC